MKFESKYNFSPFMKMHLKLSPAKWRQLCQWGDELSKQNTKVHKFGLLKGCHCGQQPAANQ